MTTTPSSSGLFHLGLSLSFGLIASVWLCTNTFLETKMDRTITVKGYATEPIRADQATWSANLSASTEVANHATEKDALKDAGAALAEARKAVTDHIGTFGLPIEDIGLGAVEISKVRSLDKEGRKTNAIERYELIQPLVLSSTRVEVIAALARSTGSLLAAGIEIEGHRPSYRYTGMEKEKLRLLGLAVDNARARGELLTKGGSVKLRELRNSSQGVFQITPWWSTRVSSYGENDTSTIQKRISAIVNVTYAIR